MSSQPHFFLKYPVLKFTPMAERYTLPPGLESYQPPDGPPVRDIWWGVYAEANKLFPQNMRAIRIFSATAILMDPPDDFLTLRNSHLTKSQVGEAAIAMNEAHDAVKIPIRTHDKTKSSLENQRKTQKVKLSRFDELWQSNTDGVLRMIMQRTIQGPPLAEREAVNYGPINMVSEKDVETLNRYWQDPKNKAETEEIRESARLLHYIFTTGTGKKYIEDLSHIWQATIIPGPLKEAAKLKILSGSTNYEVRKKMVDNPYTRFKDTLDELLSDPKSFGKKRTDKVVTEDFVFQSLKNFITRRIERFNRTMPFGLEYLEDPKPAA